ncbi:crotonase/enoyl-CoA hydratase family protein [Polymorphum gilvum]|uniref:Enoyl-CoA hydratase/isomerase family protein n=1 Tax=Polymorphum gilvum (strain LMG 25793 / CGMCC 1.9160 / SL003B-26A1) TaxID=991905 RepID=F2J257_POLGS|nr:crotonase/enoyl-CoA hydratase family protein [Polymorphum gilvum]ADZ68816.1 Enoyl-CoA hydratase/isomerase family protein [Polymorphum gilvum SL003B-26A1]
MFETIALSTDARGVATLTLSREDKHNSMSAQMIDDLTEAARQLAADRSVRVVVLTGAGTSFCAGGDLAWMRAQFDADRATRIAEARKLALMLQALNELPKPLIGRIQGQAFGGGIGLMSVCDVALAGAWAKFGLTETRLGLIPATISPYVLARMGEGNARRVFMSARIFSAEEARELGLVSRVVEADELDEAVEREVKPYLTAAPGAVAAAKALARSLGPAISDAVIAETVEKLADCWEAPEAREGIAAFFDRRKPAWAIDA